MREFGGAGGFFEDGESFCGDFWVREGAFNRWEGGFGKEGDLREPLLEVLGDSLMGLWGGAEDPSSAGVSFCKKGGKQRVSLGYDVLDQCGAISQPTSGFAEGFGKGGRRGKEFEQLG